MFCHRQNCKLPKWASGFATQQSCAMILNMKTMSKTMTALRTSYTIKPEVLLKFNEMVPSGERSQFIERMIERAMVERERALEAIAEEFATHPDFAEVRADSALWEKATVSDGLDGIG